LEEKVRQIEARLGRLEEEVCGGKRKGREVRRFGKAMQALRAEIEEIQADQRGWILALVAAFIADIVVHLFVTP